MDALPYKSFVFIFIGLRRHGSMGLPLLSVYLCSISPSRAPLIRVLGGSAFYYSRTMALLIAGSFMAAKMPIQSKKRLLQCRCRHGRSLTAICPPGVIQMYTSMSRLSEGLGKPHLGGASFIMHFSREAANYSCVPHFWRHCNVCATTSSI